jgi:hypothetical protein
MKAFWAEKNPAGLVRLANLATLGKEVDEEKEYDPDFSWCTDAVLSEHSTLDWASIVFVDQVRTDVVSQLVRHTKILPRFAVQSWRPDWTGKPRPRTPEEKRLLASKWTPRALQAMGRERLCYKAMNETREYVAFEMRDALVKSDDAFMKAVGLSMVPACVYRFGCPFKKSCGFWDRFLADRPLLKFSTIPRRYVEYDEYHIKK